MAVLLSVSNTLGTCRSLDCCYEQ